MKESANYKMRKTALLSAKIAIGSSLAIYVAQMMELQYATSAGIITLLTLVTTKWETVKLSFLRLFTYLISVMVCFTVFHLVQDMWIEFGCFGTDGAIAIA